MMALFLPTLIFSTAQLLTECISVFLTSLLSVVTCKAAGRRDLRSASGLGILAGLESLIRFNAAALPVFAGAAVVLSRRKTAMLPRILTIMFLIALIVSPWLIRQQPTRFSWAGTLFHPNRVEFGAGSPNDPGPNSAW
jgi:4-amino-4-deoxy-L-arabinose transferase-like glycosyltransferase